MSKEQEAMKAIADGNMYMLQEMLNNAPFDRIYTGRVKGINETNSEQETYNVEINQYTYNNIPKLANVGNIKINDVVKVCLPQNNYNQKFIIGKNGNDYLHDTYIQAYKYVFVVNGDINKYYPVHIRATIDFNDFPNIICLSKRLGTKTPAYPGNHPDGTASMNFIYITREEGWDGNGNFTWCIEGYDGYSSKIAHVQPSRRGGKGLVFYLRGGGCEYTITSKKPLKYNIYYERANIYPNVPEYEEWVEPRDFIGNYGFYYNKAIGVGSKRDMTENDFIIPTNRLALLTSNNRRGAAVMRVEDGTNGTNDTYGNDLIVTPGGNVYIGSGESAESLYNINFFANGSEETCLSSDNTIYLMAQCNTIANKKWINFNGSGFFPQSSGAFTLGTSGNKWGQIYSTVGTISTSDRDKKNSIKSEDEELVKNIIMGLNPVTYKFNDGTSDRTHYGFIAQDVEKLLEDNNIDSKDFAAFIKSPKIYIDINGKEVKEEGYDYGLRYEEFIAPMVKMIQIQQNEIQELKEKLSKLENKEK